MKKTTEPTKDQSGGSGTLPTTGIRYRVYFGFLALLIVAFHRPLWGLAKLATSDLHSHTVLIPLIAIYLLNLQRGKLPGGLRTSAAAGGFLGLLSLILVGWAIGLFGQAPVGTAYVAVMTLALVGFIQAGGFVFLGAAWMRAAAFPMTFLVFLAPLPEVWESALENGLKLASSEASAILFEISGTPFLRDGNIFQLPGIVLEVAQECSGIRSSYVLFITSIVAAQLFLHSPWRRIVLVGLVIPLGIIRNGFRILVIGLLCVHVGPEMIHSIIHRRGGPLFFALSLIPLFLILWLLRRGDRAAGSTLPDVSPKEPPRSETAP